jgi:hypothetical protein
VASRSNDAEIPNWLAGAVLIGLVIFAIWIWIHANHLQHGRIPPKPTPKPSPSVSVSQKVFR